METSYLFHNREEGRAAAAWAQRPGMTQALEETPPQTPLQSREEEMSSSLLLGVLPLLDFTGAGRSTDGSFHRDRTSPQDMRFSTVLLNTSWKSATSHEKKRIGGGFPFSAEREAPHTVCITSKYLLQTKYFPCEAAQPKTWRKPWYNFSSEMTVLTGKNKSIILWLGKTSTSAMWGVRLRKGKYSWSAIYCF